MTWQDFIELVSTRFEQLLETQINKDYQKLKKGGNYIDYVEKFEELKEHVRLLNGTDTQPFLVFLVV